MRTTHIKIRSPTPENAAAVAAARMSGRATVPRFVVVGSCASHGNRSRKYWTPRLNIAVIETDSLNMPRRIDDRLKCVLRIVYRQTVKEKHRKEEEEYANALAARLNQRFARAIARKGGPA